MSDLYPVTGGNRRRSAGTSVATPGQHRASSAADPEGPAPAGPHRGRIAPRQHNRRGFALVLTVVLLSLLVLVLLMVASLTRVETSITGNTRKFSQARQNALLALDRAMSRLQLEAGPDERITGTAELATANPHANKAKWAAVWDANGGGLNGWLVSGNDFALADPVAEPAVQLVGPNSSDVDHVWVPLEEIRGEAPDGTANVLLGRFGYWVGDEGVKASMAMPDRHAEIDYGPYAVTENWRRLRQQVPLAHQSFRATGASATGKQGFDPAAADNRAAIPNVLMREQIAFLDEASGTSLTASLRDHFHDWTATSYGVLASTNPAFPGLKQDLSLDPGLLGPAFQAWYDYTNYMEDPASPAAPAPLPDYPASNPEEDIRRRYLIQPPTPATPSAGELVASMAPVISDFLIQFAVWRSGLDLKVGCRAFCRLWNPYTSALVPEELELEVTGLPQIDVEIDGSTSGEVTPLVLQDILGLGDDTPLANTFVLGLPYIGEVGQTPPSDEASWLPGRVFDWRTKNPALPPAFDLRFWADDMTGVPGWEFSQPHLFTETGDTLKTTIPPTSLTLTLKRRTTGEILQSIEAPLMTSSAPAVSGPPLPDGTLPWSFAFGLRRKQPSTNAAWDDPDWLTRAGGDPRETSVAFSAVDPGYPFAAFDPNTGLGLDPIGYTGVPVTNWNTPGSSFLLNRETSIGSNISTTYNNDTPVFELPRLPVLSLGMLQHIEVAGERPFTIGNSWGMGLTPPNGPAGTIGSWWDRYFFSGVPLDGYPGMTTADPPPYFHLVFYDPAKTGAVPAFDFDTYSAQHLLNAGAFNINSTSEEAWTSVLRALRPMAPDDWVTANLVADTGTVDTANPDAVTIIYDGTQGPGTSMAARASGFMRYSQSAQETFETDDDPNDPLQSPSGFNRSSYRQGFRGGDEGTRAQIPGDLTSVDIENLATEIVTLVRQWGPFLTMEEFLSPLPAGSGSLLEQAIEAAGLNSGVDPMCAYWLTQADILTAIGQMLQPRSDTFLIRAYGETLNPVSGAIEGRAWCEALVQRVPDYFDDSQAPDATPAGDNATYGRRFKIVGFRWLTPADI